MRGPDQLPCGASRQVSHRSPRSSTCCGSGMWWSLSPLWFVCSISATPVTQRCGAGSVVASRSPHSTSSSIPRWTRRTAGQRGRCSVCCCSAVSVVLPAPLSLVPIEAQLGSALPSGLSLHLLPTSCAPWCKCHQTPGPSCACGVSCPGAARVGEQVHFSLPGRVPQGPLPPQRQRWQDARELLQRSRHTLSPHLLDTHLPVLPVWSDPHLGPWWAAVEQHRTTPKPCETPAWSHTPPTLPPPVFETVSYRG